MILLSLSRCKSNCDEVARHWKELTDARMCAVAVIALCVTPPGYFFPQMRGDYTRSVKEVKEVKGSILLEPEPRRKYLV